MVRIHDEVGIPTRKNGARGGRASSTRAAGARGTRSVPCPGSRRAVFVPGGEALRVAFRRAHGEIRDEAGGRVARRRESLGQRREPAAQEYGAWLGRSLATDSGVRRSAQRPVSSDATASWVAGAAAIAVSKSTPSRASAASAGAVGRA